MENTSNYGLKRWDGEDRILHTEFNDNWDKIDTAIKGSADKAAAALAAASALEQRSGTKLLQTFSVKSPSETVSIPLNINWAEWMEICILVDLRTSNWNATYSVWFANESDTSIGMLNSGIKGHFCATVYPLMNPATPLLGHASTGNGISGRDSYSKWTRLILGSEFSDTNFLAGTTVWIYGRK